MLLQIGTSKCSSVVACRNIEMLLCCCVVVLLCAVFVRK